MRKTILVVGSILLLFTLAVPFILAGDASAETVEEAIAKQLRGPKKDRSIPMRRRAIWAFRAVPEAESHYRSFVGHLGGLDFLHRRRLWGNHGRRRPHDHLWTRYLCQDL